MKWRRTLKVNPKANNQGESKITVGDPDIIKDKRVLIVEDGPTLTHGGMDICRNGCS